MLSDHARIERFASIYWQFIGKKKKWNIELMKFNKNTIRIFP